MLALNKADSLPLFKKKFQEQDKHELFFQMEIKPVKIKPNYLIRIHDSC